MTGFTFVTTTNNQTTGGAKREVDWNAMNKHVIDAAKTQEKARSVPGIISGIVDLGEQNLDDAEQEYKGDAAAEAKEIEAKPATYFKDGFNEKGVPCRLKCWPQKPCQQLAVTVDFVQAMVDKGQYFGNSQLQPLRLLLNREFTLSDKTKVVASPYNIRETKHEIGNGKSVWAFAKNNGLHKLAEACGLLDANGLFTKNRIGELLGKVAQFQFRVYMKPGKNGGEFFQEEVKLVGMVPEGVTVPEIPDGILYGVSFFPAGGANDPSALKQMRACIKSHQKRANNYEGSVLKTELDALGGNAPEATQAAPKVVTGVAPTAPVGDDTSFEDDVPFSPIGKQEGRMFLHMI